MFFDIALSVDSAASGALFVCKQVEQESKFVFVPAHITQDMRVQSGQRLGVLRRVHFVFH